MPGFKIIGKYEPRRAETEFKESPVGENPFAPFIRPPLKNDASSESRRFPHNTGIEEFIDIGERKNLPLFQNSFHPTPAILDPKLMLRVADQMARDPKQPMFARKEAMRFINGYLMAVKMGTPLPKIPALDYGCEGEFQNAREGGNNFSPAYLLPLSPGPVTERFGRFKILQIIQTEGGNVFHLQGIHGSNDLRRLNFHTKNNHPFAVGDEVYLLRGVYGGSGNGDDKKPTKPFQQISAKEKERLLQLYQYNPEIRAQMDQSGWTIKEKRDFFANLIAKSGSLDKALSELPGALKVLQESKWPYTWQYLFLPHLAEMSHLQVDWAYRNLPKAIEALRAASLNAEETFRVLYHLAEKTGTHAGPALENLPNAISALEVTGWKPKDKYRFLWFLSERSGNALGTALERLSTTLFELQRTGWGFEQNFPFLNFLVINAGHRMPFFRDTGLRRVIHFNPSGRPSIPPAELQPWREFYPVRFLGDEKVRQGMLIPLRSARTFPKDVEIWQVKDVEGDRLILHQGELTRKQRPYPKLQGQRVVDSLKGFHFSLRRGDKVVFWPAKAPDSGPGSFLKDMWRPFFFRP